MKKYLTPESELLTVASKEDILLISVNPLDEGDAPVVSYGDSDKWRPAN
jgi:hypothetical protein